ncbi:MAG: hypothetical protein AAGH82_02480 [Pseudomonadota bacterium]
MQQDGVALPSPDALTRRAIIGMVDVVAIVNETTQPWCNSPFFGGSAGLGLANPRWVEPIAAPGALGYFRWQGGGTIAPTLPWMAKWDRLAGDHGTASLFPEMAPQLKPPAKRPWEKSGGR